MIQGLWPLLGLAVNRLRSRMVYSAMLILGMSIGIALAVCIPVFSGAVTRSLVEEEINSKGQNLNRPPFSVRFYCLPSARQPVSVADAQLDGEWIAQMLRTEIGLPIRQIYSQIESPMLYVRPREGDTTYAGDQLFQATVAQVGGVGDYIRVLEGEPFGNAAAGASIPVWITRQKADDLGLQVGETYRISAFPSDPQPSALRVAGLWEALDPTDTFWYQRPELLLGTKLLTTAEVYQEHIEPLSPQHTGYAFWYLVLDDTRMNLGRSDHYRQGLQNVEAQVELRLPYGSMDYAPLEELERGGKRQVALSIILYAFSLPILGILGFFIASVSGMAARYQRKETAVLVSRGATRAQLLALILAESFVILAIATPIGLYGGILVARLLGYSLSFMQFISRPALQVHLASADWRMVALALVLCLLARSIPTWRSTQSTIVNYERQFTRPQARTTMMRMLLILVLAVATVYSYRQLAQLQTLALVITEPESPLSGDPLLLLAPTLFLLSVPLILSELYTLLVRPLTWLGKISHSVTAYLGLTTLGREGGQYRTPTYLLILCLSLGVFYASLARSADIWLIDRLRYEVGADLTFVPLFYEGSDALQGLGFTPTDQMNTALLPIEDFEALEGVGNATRVTEFSARLNSSRGAPRFRLLGIDRVDFPKVAYFRADYGNESLGMLMNRLAAEPEGALVPASLLEKLRLDDVIKIQVRIDDTWHAFEFKIAGTFDYFPTMYEEDEPVIVVSNAYMSQVLGADLPYHVWMNLQTTDATSVLDQLAAMNVMPNQSRDLGASIVQDQERLERVGIFGLLSLCFLSGVLLASLGLLLYHFASLVGRAIRFGILQATGIRRGELIGVVTIEYVATVLYGIIGGTAVGVLGARLYVPFFPLTDTAAAPVPPFLSYVDWSSTGWMIVGMLAVLAAIEALMVTMMMRSKVFEVLRLGNQE